MPRLPRVYIEGILYYVTSKGGHNQDIFIKPSDYQEYISLIDKYKKQYSFKLFSYALLPTHLHMLIELKNNIGISNIMHDINSLYTKIFNSQYNRKGHLFQERFKATFAEKEDYLLPVTRHIHLNPKRSGLADDPKDYRYSSYFQFLDPAKRQYPDMTSEIEEVFGVLKGREDMFEKYMSSGEAKEMDDLKKKLRQKRILGSKAFVGRIRKTIEETAKRQKKPPLPKRLMMIYLLLGGMLILITSVTLSYFSKKTTMLRTEYDNTLLLYKRTLEILEKEKEAAIEAQKDVEEYAWKIRLTEKALEDIEKERAKVLSMQKEIEGYSWRVDLRQIGGPKIDFLSSDTIFFKDNRVNSINLGKEGFSGSAYSKRELRNGNIVWETIQTNAEGDTASWRGEWNGEIMKGILSLSSANDVRRDFSFVSSSERLKEELNYQEEKGGKE